MTDPKPTQETEEDAAATPEAFDLWLQRGLHQIYDKVANEPIPEEWLKLIEDDRKK